MQSVGYSEKMTPIRWAFLVSLIVLSIISLSATFTGAKDGKTDNDTEYLLRYKFSPKEELVWRVDHLNFVDASVQKVEKSAKTGSISKKVWRVKELLSNGNVIFEHIVTAINMTQKLSGSQPMNYNSEVHKSAPPGYADIEKCIGKVLTVVEMDPQGKIVRHEKKDVSHASTAGSGYMTIPLPEKKMKVGGEWSEAHNMTVVDENKKFLIIKSRQTFRLAKVEKGIAEIWVSTIMLSPFRNNPKVYAQVAPRLASGKVYFDVAKGKVIAQQMRLNESIVDAAGHASNVKYETDFEETLLKADGTWVANLLHGEETKK